MGGARQDKGEKRVRPTRGGKSSWLVNSELWGVLSGLSRTGLLFSHHGGQQQADHGRYAIKPVGWDRTFCESLQYMIYDPANGTILTRTPLSWLKIIVFYCIYYCFLAGFWIGCLNIFF